MAEDVAAVADEPCVGFEGFRGGADAEFDVGLDAASGEHPVGGECLGEADGPGEGEVGEAGDGVADVGDDLLIGGRGCAANDEAEEPAERE